MNDSLDAEHDVNNYEESIHKFSSKNTSQRFSDKMASNRFFFLYVLFWSSQVLKRFEIENVINHTARMTTCPCYFLPCCHSVKPINNGIIYYIIKRSSHLSNSGWVYVVSTFVKTNILTLLCYNVIMVWCIVYSITV